MKKLVHLLIIMAFLFSPVDIFSQESERDIIFLLSIEDVRLIAISNNLDIKLARLDSKIKGTELSYKEAAFDTILNATAGYTQDERKQSSTIFGTKSLEHDYNIGLDKKLKSGTDVEIDFTNKREWTNSPFVSLNPYHESEIAISLTQPIARNFFGLIDRGNIEIIKWEIKNAELESYIKIEDSVLSAEKAYWNLVLAQEQFKIKKEMLKKAVRLFNQYRRKLRIGLVETGDVLATEANMHIRESELLRSLNELKTAEELLKVELNLQNELNISASDSLEKNEFNPDFVDCLKTAFENRRDYTSKRNDIEAKTINLKMKSNSRFPQIDLKATFATNGLDSRYYRAMEGVIEDSNPNYYMGIEFNYPLENNEANSLYEKAKLEKAKAVIELQKIERRIISDIDTRFRDILLNKANTSKMQRVENLQKGKLGQEEKRFKYGRSNSDLLIRYQEDLLEAELMTQKAYLDYKNSILDLMGDEDYFLRYIGLE